MTTIFRYKTYYNNHSAPLTSLRNLAQPNTMSKALMANKVFFALFLTSVVWFHVEVNICTKGDDTCHFYEVFPMVYGNIVFWWLSILVYLYVKSWKTCYYVTMVEERRRLIDGGKDYESSVFSDGSDDEMHGARMTRRAFCRCNCLSLISLLLWFCIIAQTLASIIWMYGWDTKLVTQLSVSCVGVPVAMLLFSAFWRRFTYKFGYSLVFQINSVVLVKRFMRIFRYCFMLNFPLMAMSLIFLYVYQDTEYLFILSEIITPICLSNFIIMLFHFMPYIKFFNAYMNKRKRQEARTDETGHHDSSGVDLT